MKTFSLNPNTVKAPEGSRFASGFQGNDGFAGNTPGEIEEKSSGN
ncbi:MAG: hypothetical protein ACTH3S_00520 [Marinobacter sp.]